MTTPTTPSGLPAPLAAAPSSSEATPYALLPAEPGDHAAIAGLLAACGLPAEQSDVATVMVVRQPDAGLIGCVAWECHGGHAVMTVLAVMTQAKGCGVGAALMSGALRRMIGTGARSVSLLAIGSPEFFGRFGFLKAARADLPAEVVATGRFDRPDWQLASPLLLHLDAATLVGPATRDDMPAVLAIYNDAVAHSTATYDYEPRALEEQIAIFEQKMLDGYGFFVARTADGTVAGFSTYGLYRTRPGWRFACEHSVYVAAPWRGRRVGPTLLAPVMRHARRRGFHTMVGVVDAGNAASVRMHRRAGFVEVGTMREGGYKFDRWLDVAFVQAML